MQFPSRFIILILIATTVFIAGCTQGPGPVPVVTPAPVMASPLQDLAISTTDLPACFSLAEENVKSYADVGQLAKDLGWQAGYVATYACPAEGPDPTIIVHSLAVYPENTMSGIASMVDQQDRTSGLLYENLSFPDQGTPMRGFYGNSRGIQDSGISPGTYLVNGGREGAEMNTSAGSNVTEIIFYRGNIFEVLTMTGPKTNVTLLRDLAQKASAKIPPAPPASHGFLPGTTYTL
ncbi:MAG: hypothetical protein EHM53_08675, partial [Methanoregulaceae archaeon]